MTPERDDAAAGRQSWETAGELRPPTGLVAGLTSALVAVAESSGFLGHSDEPAGCTCSDQACAPGQSPVCRYCPICRMAQGVGQVDPRVVTDLLAVARDLLIGLGGALGAAGQHRAGAAGQGADAAPDLPPSEDW